MKRLRPIAVIPVPLSIFRKRTYSPAANLISPHFYEPLENTAWHSWQPALPNQTDAIAVLFVSIAMFLGLGAEYRHDLLKVEGSNEDLPAAWSQVSPRPTYRLPPSDGDRVEKCILPRAVQEWMAE